MQKPETVEDFIKTRVLKEHRDSVELIRKLMRELAPKIEEKIAYGIPAYKGNKILAVISPTKKDITFSFSRGGRFEDKYDLLRGVGKSSKHVKIKSAETANVKALKYYIRQAIQHDKE